MALLRAHPVVARRALLIVGSLAAAYLWAVVTGHGLHGLKDVVALDKTGEIPDANFALIAALGALFVCSVAYAYLSETPPTFPLRRRGGLTRALAVCAVAGGVLFLLALGVSAVA